MSNQLPNFESPPIEEVAIGFQFKPLKDYCSAHSGLFWNLVRDRYPIIKENPPLPHVVEEVETKPPSPTIQPVLRLGSVATISSRIWLIRNDDSELIQIQRDQFFRNWRRRTDEEAYPRFRVLIERFREDWDAFSRFLEQEGLGKPIIDQCELTYVNQIPKGHGWESFADLHKVLSVVAKTPEDSLLASADTAAWGAEYLLPESQGKLFAAASQGFRGRDFQYVLSLSMRARGMPTMGAGEFDWFELAHEWVVRGFCDLTTSAIHELWGRKC